MEAIRCLIVDDEPLAIKIIETYLRKMTNITIVGSCESAISALELMQAKPIDLLFLDIQMPEINGLELIETLSFKPYIIIITAFRDFAVDSFELAVNDYLLKPVSFSRFMKSMQRAIKNIEMIKQKERQAIKATNKPAEISYITVKEKYKSVKIKVNTILYIESFREYSHIHTANEEIITRQNLSYFEEFLKESQFLRIHKSYLININKVKSFSPSQIFIEEFSLPIGRSYKKLVQEKLIK